MCFSNDILGDLKGCNELRVQIVATHWRLCRPLKFFGQPFDHFGRSHSRPVIHENLSDRAVLALYFYRLQEPVGYFFLRGTGNSESAKVAVFWISLELRELSDCLVTRVHDELAWPMQPGERSFHWGLV